MIYFVESCVRDVFLLSLLKLQKILKYLFFNSDCYLKKFLTTLTDISTSNLIINKLNTLPILI